LRPYQYAVGIYISTLLEFIGELYIRMLNVSELDKDCQRSIANCKLCKRVDARLIVTCNGAGPQSVFDYSSRGGHLQNSAVVSFGATSRKRKLP